MLLFCPKANPTTPLFVPAFYLLLDVKPDFAYRFAGPRPFFFFEVGELHPPFNGFLFSFA